MKKWGKVLSALYILLSVIPLIKAEELLELRVERIITAPAVDGFLNESCWQVEPVISGFVQFHPQNGLSASEQTFGWVYYDRENLYFGFYMKDSQPERIYAELAPRNSYFNNDSITVIIDGYGDEINSIEFTLNARGIQSTSVDVLWRGRAKIQKDGWTAEFAIPFKSLRFPKKRELSFRVNFSRYIHRLDETDYWAPVGRDDILLEKSGVLSGLEGISWSNNIEIFPYAGGRYGKWEKEADRKFAYGLDFKYGLTSNLVFDLTVSPDFSEVEEDPYIYQLSPYENYYSENRPFFYEGSDFFYSYFDLFYSRRVEDVRFAGKLTGKVGKFSLGLLGARSRYYNDAGGYFSVLRVKRDVLRNSEIGLYYSGYNDAQIRNNNLAVDWNIRFNSVDSFSGQVVQTLLKGEKGANRMYHFSLRRLRDSGLGLGIHYDRIEPNVNLFAGYIGRKDYQSYRGVVEYGWRRRSGFFKYIWTSFSGLVIQDCQGATRQLIGTWNGTVQFAKRSRLMAGASIGEAAEQRREGKQIVWDERRFAYRSFSVELRMNQLGLLKALTAGFSLSRKGVYDRQFALLIDGVERRGKLLLTFKPWSFLDCNLSLNYIEQEDCADGRRLWAGTTVSSELFWQLSRAFYLDLNYNYETRQRQYNFSLLFCYDFGIGNLLQFGIKRAREFYAPEYEKGYSIFLKISSLLRI